jgi:trehalose-6-phosphate synthase
MAEAIHCALAMPLAERRSRMRELRKVVREHNIFEWGANLMKALLRIETADRHGAESEVWAKASGL